MLVSSHTLSWHSRKTPGNPEFDLIYPKLDEGYGEILRPAETSLCNKDKRDHHAFTCWSCQNQEGAE